MGGRASIVLISLMMARISVADSCPALIDLDVEIKVSLKMVLKLKIMHLSYLIKIKIKSN